MKESLERAFESLSHEPCGGQITCVGLTGLVREWIRSGCSLFRHPLGFVQVEMGEDFNIPCGYDRARIHIFERDYGIAATSRSIVHSHNWELKSAVIYGKIENVTFELCDSINGAFSVFRVDYRSKTDAILVDSNRLVNLNENTREMHSNGLIYCQTPETFHSTVVLSELAITFLLARSSAATAFAVFGKGEHSDHENIRSELAACDRETLFKTLETLS